MDAVNKNKLIQTGEFTIAMHAQFQSALTVLKRQRLFGKKKTYLLIKKILIKKLKD